MPINPTQTYFGKVLKQRKMLVKARMNDGEIVFLKATGRNKESVIKSVMKAYPIRDVLAVDEEAKRERVSPHARNWLERSMS